MQDAVSSQEYNDENDGLQGNLVPEEEVEFQVHHSTDQHPEPLSMRNEYI